MGAVEAELAPAAARGPHVGAVEEIAVVPVERPWLARLFGDPLLIGGTIGVLALLLGLSLYRAAKRIDPPTD